MDRFKVWELPRENRKMVKHGSTTLWCEGKCGLSYNQCLKSRNVDLKESMRELKALDRLAIKPLFNWNSKDRINPFMVTRYKAVS